tara:strand:- start:423 stop:1061 length:639 start_codon:yes stop_codon:yes gene_type:complete
MKITLLFILLSTISIAQDGLKDEYVHDFEKVYDADTIFYYGIDFSNFGLYNPEKVGHEQIIMKFFPVWMNKVHEAYSKGQIEMILKKEVKKNFQQVQSRYKLLRDEWIGFDKHTLETQQIQELVKDYKLKRTTGIGLVLIIENFNKEKENARVNYTFFDITSREILWSIETKGEATGAGMTNHWATAIKNSFGPFKLTYRSALRKVKKSRKK